ncbi:TonB-dependent receptor [Winogradskyella sp. PG-2]|uniref:TonB-dependent receptor n=1 Tax=Winogradskyella sp. PG-2 TaxID=754409 RepID=UPI0004589480|nr:TonB-dependent receptor [Winogradskyella sp. PG-2]BAO77494.1 outer membrane hemin receptor [Winogradskyella sp. PG-2]
MKNIFLILFILITSFSFSQECNSVLTGKISDFHDNTTLENTTIKIIGTNKITISDEKGNFEFNNLCKQTYNIEVSHIACKTKIISIEVDGNTHKLISLEHHFEELSEVTVKANEQTTTKTAQETVIKVDILEKYSSSSLGDALREVPGVSSINTGNNIVKPMIHGLHSSRILIMNNGVRLQDQEWGIEHAPNIDINSANQISVIKGSGALAYGGDAVGGVVVLKPTRTYRIDTLYGRAIIGGQSNGKGYNATTTLNKNYSSGWFAQVQGSLRQVGDLKAPDYYLTNSGFKSTAFSLSGGKKMFESGFEVYYSFIDSEVGILRSAHIGNIKNLATAINAPEPLFTDDSGYDITQPKQEVTHHLFKASYYKRFRNFGKVDVQYDYQNNQRFEFDIRRGGRSDIPAVDLVLQTHTISANAKVDNNAELKYNFGLLGRYQNNVASPDTGVRRLIPDYDRNDFGIYTTGEWKVSDDIIVDAGLRYDFSRMDATKFYRRSDWEDRGYDEDFRDIIEGSVVSGGEIVDGVDPNASQYKTNPLFDYHNVSGALGFKYQFNDNHQLSFGYNLASRAPNASELFSDGLHHSAARIEIGDIRIESEQSHRLSATYGYRNSGVDLKVEPYFNRINDFIYLIPGPEGIIPLIRGPFPVWEYIQTDATMFGADITVNYEFSTQWNFNHKSSFIKGYDTKADLPLLDIPAFTTTNSITYTNAKWKNFSTSLISEWAFEQNEFPTEYNYTIPIADEDDIDVDLSPPPGYHLMHLQSEITLPVFKQSSMNIRLSIDNIFNTNYRNYLNRLRFFADEMGRNVRLQLQLNF